MSGPRARRHQKQPGSATDRAINWVRSCGASQLTWCLSAPDADERAFRREGNRVRKHILTRIGRANRPFSTGIPTGTPQRTSLVSSERMRIGDHLVNGQSRARLKEPSLDRDPLSDVVIPTEGAWACPAAHGRSTTITSNTRMLVDEEDRRPVELACRPKAALAAARPAAWILQLESTMLRTLKVDSNRKRISRQRVFADEGRAVRVNQIAGAWHFNPASWVSNHTEGERPRLRGRMVKAAHS